MEKTWPFCNVVFSNGQDNRGGIGSPCLICIFLLLQTIFYFCLFCLLLFTNKFNSGVDSGGAGAQKRGEAGFLPIRV